MSSKDGHDEGGRVEELRRPPSTSPTDDQNDSRAGSSGDHNYQLSWLSYMYWTNLIAKVIRVSTAIIIRLNFPIRFVLEVFTLLKAWHKVLLSLHLSVALFRHK